MAPSPKPKPGKTTGSKPTRPGGRATALDRIVDADLAARRTAGDLIVRLDVPAPDRATLAKLIPDKAARAAVAAAEKQRAALAERIAEDPAFADDLVTAPARTLAEAGVIEATTSEPAEPLAVHRAVAGVRFEVPATVVPDRIPELAVRVDDATQDLLSASMTTASATDAAWRAARTDPDPTVRAAANALPWPDYGIEAGSAAAASITTEVIAAVRAALGLPPAGQSSGSGPEGDGPAPTGPTVLAASAAVFDPDVAARGVRTVRITTRGH